MKIHHNTAKKARKAGIELTIVENEIVASKNGATLASGLQGNIVLDQAIARLNGSLTGQPGSRAKLAAAFKGARGLAGSRKTAEDDEIEDNDEEIELGQDRSEDDDEDDRPEGASIVKRKYKQIYRPHHMTCGDDLARDISEHVFETVEIDGKEVTRVSLAKLRKFAKANECWVEGYASL